MTIAEDQKLEIAIARMLRIGVLIAASMVLLGGVLYLAKTNAPAPDFRHFHAATPGSQSLAGVLAGVSTLHAESLILLGIFLLIATPVLRVIFCMVGFGLQRDWLYVAISTLVFVVLVFSLLRAGR